MSLELEERIRSLEERCDALQKENENLRMLLISCGIPIPGSVCVPEHELQEEQRNELVNLSEPPAERSKELPVFSVSKSSPMHEKIQLFKSLFHGREDVYAKRWENQSKGTHGYSFACGNEWIAGVCAKIDKSNTKKNKCAACENPSYLPYDQAVLERHLAGKDVIGIYVLQKDETCWLLAIDLDDGDWIKDVEAMRKVCHDNEIPCAVERSRSGSGAHIWFFFTEPVSAAAARRFGTALLTKAMQSDARLTFKSYDRMFPNQDTMPKGGFGNLIALPLQKRAAKECKGSLFIDEDGNAYPDQWAYLSSMHRMTPGDLESALDRLGSNPLGILAEENSEEPWKVRTVDKVPVSDKTKQLECVIADRIYVSTEGVSDFVQNRLKRLGAFKNKEFYKAQKMRLSTRDKPRIIFCTEYSGKYLCLPRGCSDAINEWAETNHIAVKWKDEQYPGKAIDVRFRGKLREEQKEAFDALTAFDKGVLSATTAFGKTVLGAALIGKRRVNTLILVHRTQLLDQWKERLEEFLEIKETLPEAPKTRGRKTERSVIGTYASGKDRRSGIIDLAMVQSISKDGGEVPDWVGEYGLVIVDECHHVPASNFEAVLKKIRAKYTCGLTATPKRKDGWDPIITMYLGNIRYTVDAKEQARQRPFDHVMVPRFTGMVFQKLMENEEPNIGKYYAQIAEDDLRNQMVADDVLNCVNEGRNCLVLSERTAHVERLAEMIREKYSEVFVLIGGQTPAVSKRQIAEVREASHDKPIVICATGKYIGEGFDESRLDTLFLTMPISWEGLLAQYAGRLHRLYEGKKEARIYDYVDDQAVMLEKMYAKRLRGYASLGYRVSIEHGDANVRSDIIYDQKTFIEPFMADVGMAKRKVVIVSPFMWPIRVKWFIEAVKRNPHPIHISVITRPLEAFTDNSRENFAASLEILRENGIEVVFRPGIHQKFCVMDDKVVWYGSINFLSFGRSQESVIRLITGSVADTLMKSVLGKVMKQ